MKPARTASKLLRAVIAVVFGVISLAHAPAMAFAKAGGALHYQPSSAAAPAINHQHHHPVPKSPVNPVTSDGQVVCFGLGCFQSVTPQSNMLAAPCLLLGQLLPGAAHTMNPVPPDLADPPPRLQG